MSLFKKDLSYLGVDLGAGGVKLVELKKVKGRPQLWTYGILEEAFDLHTASAAGASDPRVAHYAQLLRHLVERSRITTKRATASLPVSQVFHAVITLPAVPPKELDYHVRAKVAKVLPHPIDEMQLVYQPLEKNGKQAITQRKDVKLLVTAARKQLIQFYTDIFQSAGLILDELETEAFALARSLVGRDIATVMVVDIGAERTNFFIIDDGAPVTHRSIQVGGRSIDRELMKALGIDETVVGQVKYDLSRSAGSVVGLELLGSVVDPIIKEIQYGFDLFLHQTGNEEKRPEKIILTGGAALFPACVSAIQRAFAMKIFVGDPWARVVYQQRLKPTLDVIGPRMAVAIGLALRGILPDTKTPAKRE